MRRRKSIKKRLINFFIKKLSYTIAIFMLIAPIVLFAYSITQYMKYNVSERVFVEEHWEEYKGTNPVYEGEEYWVEGKYETKNSYTLHGWILLYLCMPVFNVLISERLTVFKTRTLFQRKFRFINSNIYNSNKIRFLDFPIDFMTLALARTFLAWIFLFIAIFFELL